MTEYGLSKAQSNNLPRLVCNQFMIARFFANNELFSSAEIRGVKLDRDSRDSYGDSAIGYVQVKREGNVCIVEGKICPEHRVRGKNYNVTLEIDEIAKEIQSVLCHDCAAALGGCKHAVAFLMWAYRKSEEPSTTDIQCYWKKSKLAIVGTNLKFTTVEQIGGVLPQPLPAASNGQFLKDVVEGLKSSSSSSILLKYVGGKRLISDLSLQHLLRQFLKEGLKTPTQFIDFCRIILTQELYKKACNQTKEQCNSNCGMNRDMAESQLQSYMKLQDAKQQQVP